MEVVSKKLRNDFGKLPLVILVNLIVFSYCTLEFGIIPYHDIYTPYKESLRGDLFSGLLTLAGFMLALKTFVILFLKDKLYDAENYIIIHVKKMDHESDGEINLYKGLKDLGNLLSLTIVTCLVAAVMQLAIGLSSCKWAIALCLSFATGGIGMVFYSWLMIHLNLHDFFESISQEGDSKIKAVRDKLRESDQEVERSSKAKITF